MIVICFAGAVSGSAQPAKKESARPAEKDVLTANNQQAAIARLFGIVNELKGALDKPAAALLQSEIADILWRFDEPAARVVFRLAFDSVRHMETANASSIDAEAKKQALSQARRRLNAVKTILKRYGLHDRKGAESWLQELENDLQVEQKNSTRSSRISVEQGELLAEMAISVVADNPKEAQRLGALALTAESIPPAFSRLLMAFRTVDKTISDALFRQALFSMRANGFRYDSTLITLTNYGFFANGSALPDVASSDVSLLTQYFLDSADAHLALLRRGALNTDERMSLGNLFSFLSSRALSIVASNSPTKLTLLQSNLAEIARGLTIEQRQQAETLASLAKRSQATDENDSDVASQIRRAEQEKNTAARDTLFRNLVLQLMRAQPEQALEVARKIDDSELRSQSEDDVYLILLENAFRSGSNDNARNVALKINDTAARARWLAEIAVKSSSRSGNSVGGADSLSEAYAIAAKSDNTAAKLDALLFIAQQFLTLDRDRGFDVLSEALKTANRIDPKTQTSVKTTAPTIRVMTFTVVNGKERSAALRPTLDSVDFNEIGAFAETDYFQTSSLGDSLKDHLLRSKYFIALARSILGVPRQGPAYERTLGDVISN